MVSQEAESEGRGMTEAVGLGEKAMPAQTDGSWIRICR